MKRKLLAVAMMVVMSASLVACSGKDAPKENTTAGTNDSAVEATTGTTTQDVAESNEETTTPDVSEAEEDQVGETSVGTVGGSYSDSTSKDNSDLFVGDGFTNKAFLDLGKTQVKIYKDNPLMGCHTIFWTPSEKWNYDDEIIVSFDAYMALDAGYHARPYKPTDSYGFETFNVITDEEASICGLNKTTLTFRILGDLTSDEAWKEQLNRDWENINIEYQDGEYPNYNYSNGEYTDCKTNEYAIKVIKDCQLLGDSQEDRFAGYTTILIDRPKGIELTFTYVAKVDEHYNDDDALNAAKSFVTARRKE